jgi:hypothetical protein
MLHDRFLSLLVDTDIEIISHTIPTKNPKRLNPLSREFVMQTPDRKANHITIENL